MFLAATSAGKGWSMSMMFCVFEEDCDDVLGIPSRAMPKSAYSAKK